MRGNSFTDSAGTPTQIYGVYAASGSGIITDNFFGNCTTAGVYVGVSTYLVHHNLGWTTETNIISADFAIDSVAVVEVTTAHGLDVAPSIEDIAVMVLESTAVDDWACGYVKVHEVTSTNVVCKVNVTTASATGGAKAKLGIKVDVR